MLLSALIHLAQDESMWTRNNDDNVCSICICTLLYSSLPWRWYLVSEGVILDWVLCCQTDAAKQDEEEDEVGEDVMVDYLMARNPESKENKTRKEESDKEKGRVSDHIWEWERGWREDQEVGEMRGGSVVFTYLLVWLKMKKARASGMGTAFSFNWMSESGRGLGPTGISGSSSSSSPDESENKARRNVRTYGIGTGNQLIRKIYKHAGWRNHILTLKCE